ncbi:ABC transporter permease subunit [Paeniglutamicibacter psychrophenolicus]|uniref:Osmoprotectant transport system permease protein n=1 Tax=Paeniglutamicibacter psychrophenolicus TaxID=257454 RepID=A0ABS4WG86_9MICC|nr:ABC transporter permease [Paeniglutamicibacter psychrophenolicus]MBP2374604.1 osmoprotectant transport system permease protein [Paeniglutamicibacter psychrophenolicus]
MINEMLTYFAQGANWAGETGIPARLGEHLWYSFLAVAAAAVLAFPVGVFIGHTGTGKVFLVSASNVLRALPSLGIMTLLVLLMGIGLLPPLAALVLIAIPPILAGVYAGVANVDPEVVDAARAIGMKDSRIILQVELPLALPLILGGFRGAILQVVATATIAAYVNLGGLGRYIFDGLALYDYGQVLVGAVLVTGLALVLDGLLALAARALSPARRAIAN